MSDPTPDPPTGRSGPVDVVLSAEHLTVGTEWTVSGAVRFRRRITTATRTVEVTLRREELEIEVRDVRGTPDGWSGTDRHGPAVAAPPVVTAPGVFVLREEVPEVGVTIRPYERVTVHVDRLTEDVPVTATVRHEAAHLVGDTGAPHPERDPLDRA